MALRLMARFRPGARARPAAVLVQRLAGVVGDVRAGRGLKLLQQHDAQAVRDRPRRWAPLQLGQVGHGPLSITSTSPASSAGAGGGVVDVAVVDLIPDLLVASSRRCAP